MRLAAGKVVVAYGLDLSLSIGVYQAARNDGCFAFPVDTPTLSIRLALL